MNSPFNKQQRKADHAYLLQEAAFQDKKIQNNPRKRLNIAYNDYSSKFRYDYRNSLLGDLHGKHVLDLGCGSGFASMEALRAGAYVTAIDISPKSIDHLVASARAEHLDKHLHAVVMDAHHLAIGDQTFDIVFGNGILHHLTDLDSALHELHRVLKPGGYTVFLEPLGMNPLLNLFRKATPHLRTSNEQPLRTQELSIIKQVFPNTNYTFFDLATLFAKVPLLLGLKKVSQKLQPFLIRADNHLIRRKPTGHITFLQQMSWFVAIKMTKE